MKMKAPYIVVILIMAYLNCSITNLQSEDEFLLEKGIAYYNEDRFGDALEIFTEITSSYKHSELLYEGWYYKGLTEIQLAEDSVTEVIVSQDYFELAIKSFQEVNNLSDLFPNSILKTGYCYYSLNNFDEARKYFKLIFNDFSKTNQVDNAYLYNGHTYRKEMKFDTSIIWYEDIINKFYGSSAYDNALYWAGDHYFIHREDSISKVKSLAYLKEYCSLTTASDPQYFLANNKIEVMENE